MKINYTFLSTFRKCRRKAYLQYIKQVVPRDKIDHRNFMVGTVVDKLLEQWIKRDYDENYMEGNARGLFNWYAERRKITYRNTDDKEQLIQKTEKAARLLQEVVFDEGLPNEEVVPQKIVKFQDIEGYEQFEFYARLDLWFPKRHAVWDLKTTVQKKWLDPFQLEFFAWALEHVGETVEELAFLVPLIHPSVQYVEIDLSQKAVFELDIINLLEEVEKEEVWSPNPKDCWGCPVYHHCEQEDEIAVVTEKKGSSFRVSIGEDLIDESKGIKVEEKQSPEIGTGDRGSEQSKPRAVKEDREEDSGDNWIDKLGET